jgi:DNA-binding NtrC family response regulator
METAHTKENKSPIRILQLDCDKQLLFVSKEILQLFGDFEIDLASSFLEAHNGLEKKQYDVIVSGYFFDSGKNGLDFFKELNAEGSKVPFIMFTIYDEIANEAMKMGVSGFIAQKGDCEKVFTELSNKIREVSEI